MPNIIKTCETCGKEYNATSGVARFCSDGCHLLANVKPAGDCVVWTGTLDKDGYGTVKLRGRRVRKTHRAFYAEFVGPIPDGMMVCHECDNPRCCNPLHLFVGSALDNKTDSVRKARHVHGEAVYWKRKITEVQAREILASDEPAPVLAERYGVHRNSIYYLRKGKSWKHLPRLHGVPDARHRESGSGPFTLRGYQRP